MQLTPTYLMDLERNMRLITSQEYQRLLGGLWYKSVTKELTSGAKAERMTWLLDSASIEYVGRMGGEVSFEDIVSNTTEFVNKTATAGLKLAKNQFEDHDGQGVDLAAHWSRQMGAYGAYWPQKQIALAIKTGGAATSLAYDGQIFFSGSHPVNPFDTSVGTYANDLTGAASGAFPGACPIDQANAATDDVAFDNLNKVWTYVQSLKMPNGQDPRMLKPRAILIPPALMKRASLITDAKFIARASSSGGGSADVSAVIAKWGFGEPIVCPELGSAFSADGGSDTTYYVVAEQIAGDQLGGLIYVNREPFSIVYHGEMTDAELSRRNELQWVTRGRNVVGYGHPYLIFRVKAT